MRTNVVLHFSLSAIALAAAAFSTGCTVGDSNDGDEDSSVSEAALSSNEHTAYNFFVSKGLTKAESAGIVGNLIQESSVSPTVYQYGGGPGRGIAQWSAGGRWDTSHDDNVTWYASQHGESRWSLSTQLNFIWFELTNYGYGYSQLKAAGNSITAATEAFQDRYEICGECDSTNRIHDAEEVYDAYSGGHASGGAECYSGTKGRDMADNACVQSKYDDLWYQCDNGSWVDRWTDPDNCDGVYPL